MVRMKSRWLGLLDLELLAAECFVLFQTSLGCRCESCVVVNDYVIELGGRYTVVFWVSGRV